MRLPNGYGSVVKLSGKRRNPYCVKKTAGFHYDSVKDKWVQDFIIIGYAKTKSEALQMLAEYNTNPFDANASNMTFSDVYKAWSEVKYKTVVASSTKGYKNAYNTCKPLWNKKFRDLKLADLQHIIDTCGKNYPTLKKVKLLFGQLFSYAMKYEICQKDYSQYVDLSEYRSLNPNKIERERLTQDEIIKLWSKRDDPDVKMVLMLIYSGVRISEFLKLKKCNVHLDKQYFDVLQSKTENGIRKVPIPDHMLEFYKFWLETNPDCEYLLTTIDSGIPFSYTNYFRRHFKPVMKDNNMDATPHCCRYTCVSLLQEAKIAPILIKKIAGHSAYMDITEKVYSHFDVSVLVEAINKTWNPQVNL